MVKDQQVVTKTGKVIDLKADTICVHGDGANALEFVRNIRETLNKEGVSITQLGVNTWGRRNFKQMIFNSQRVTRGYY